MNSIAKFLLLLLLWLLYHVVLLAYSFSEGYWAKIIDYCCLRLSWVKFFDYGKTNRQLTWYNVVRYETKWHDKTSFDLTWHVTWNWLYQTWLDFMTFHDKTWRGASCHGIMWFLLAWLAPKRDVIWHAVMKDRMQYWDSFLVFLLFSQFISPEATNKWSLIATLSGTSFCLAVIVVILVFIVAKKRKNKQQEKVASNRDQYEMKELGTAVAG